MEKQMELEYIEVADRRTEAMPKVEELLQILIETNQQQAAQSVAFLLDFMDRMEGQLDSVNQELQAVRKELNVLQDAPGVPTIKERLEHLMKSLELKVSSFQGRLKEIKEALNDRAGQVVDHFKSQGVRALAGVTKTLGIKSMYAAIQSACEKQFASMDETIGSIHEVERKYREAVMHIKNAGRIITGKETQKAVVYPEKGFFSSLRKPCQALKTLHSSGIAKANQAIVKLDTLEKAGKQAAKGKRSIADKLKMFKENQKQAGVQNLGQVVKQKEKGNEHGR